jgi:hypothetical protein
MSAKFSSSKLLLLASGVMAGVGIGWLTAPRRGRWVRNQARQKLIHLRRLTGRRWYKRRKDAANRLRGGWAITREAFQRQPAPATDERTLTDRVHSELGRQFASTLQHANLSAVGDVIYIHGYLPSEADKERLIEAIAGVEGVQRVRAEAVRIGHPADHGRVTDFPRRRAR